MQKLIELSQSEWLYKNERDYILRNLGNRNKYPRIIDFYQGVINLRQSSLAAELRSTQILDELAAKYPCTF